MDIKRYEIRIYDTDSSCDVLDYEPIIVEFAKNKEELFELWEKLYKMYEGFSYTVFDVTLDKCIIGGSFDSMDYEIIEEYD